MGVNSANTAEPGCDIQETNSTTESFLIRNRRSHLEGKYKKMEPRENCESGREVTTKSECEKAAEDLGLTFVRDGSWSFAQRYCLIYKNRVCFNRNTGKTPDSMEHAMYRAICVENPGSERSECGPITTKDMLGPFFEDNAPNSEELAPASELNNPELAVILKGQVLGKDCRGMGGALVEVWYDGGNSACYTTRHNPTKQAGLCYSPNVWYRGKTKADAEGRYEFKATIPVIYEGRPILHYHYKVTVKETNIVTQAYFKDKVPPRYEDYVKGRESQFLKVRATKAGRQATMNIRLDL